MGKAFDQIMEGLEDVADYMGGKTDGFAVHVPAEVDVKAIRNGLGMSQSKFAQVLNVSVGRVRDWEQKRSPVDAPARAFLTVLEFEPEAVERALAKASERMALTVHSHGKKLRATPAREGKDMMAHPATRKSEAGGKRSPKHLGASVQLPKKQMSGGRLHKTAAGSTPATKGAVRRLRKQTALS